MFKPQHYLTISVGYDFGCGLAEYSEFLQSCKVVFASLHPHLEAQLGNLLPDSLRCHLSE